MQTHDSLLKWNYHSHGEADHAHLNEKKEEEKKHQQQQPSVVDLSKSGVAADYD
jgi:hypothetical protein